MAFFKQDNKRAEENANSFKPIPEGDYEVLVTKGAYRPVEPGKTKTANINLELTVRSDVEQEHKGRKIFHTFWISDPSLPAKEGKTKTPFEFCMGMIEEFGLHIGIPDGAEFPDEAAWVKYVTGKPVKARIHIEEYDGKENNRVKWFNKSDNPMVKAQQTKGELDGTSVGKANNTPPANAEDPFANNGQPIDISDDDLPF
jgi:hypothetical protein